ncbi:hypothetical protein [Parasedimentitalea marina]|uniref:hypothetical protein n=1 Tax=Parasedimentitalea marina TaxID=2483033 RepID=UPI0013E3D892|nr:hypothetical protein [Parasedimentitalea marina]
MHKWMLSLTAIAVLAACGVDGEPVQPSLNAGIGISNSGVHARGGVGVHQGPLSLYLGF